MAAGLKIASAGKWSVTALNSSPKTTHNFGVVGALNYFRIRTHATEVLGNEICKGS